MCVMELKSAVDLIKPLAAVFQLNDSVHHSAVFVTIL